MCERTRSQNPSQEVSWNLHQPASKQPPCKSTAGGTQQPERRESRLSRIGPQQNLLTFTPTPARSPAQSGVLGWAPGPLESINHGISTPSQHMFLLHNWRGDVARFWSPAHNHEQDQNTLVPTGTSLPLPPLLTSDGPSFWWGPWTTDGRNTFPQLAAAAGDMLLS